MNNNSQPQGADPGAQQYFSSLPAYIQESILQSGVKLQTAEEMHRFVEKLNKKEQG